MSFAKKSAPPDPPRIELKDLEYYEYIKNDIYDKPGGWWNNDVPVLDDISDIYIHFNEFDITKIKYLSIVEDDPQNPIRIRAAVNINLSYRWAFRDWHKAFEFANNAISYLEYFITTSFSLNMRKSFTAITNDVPNLQYFIIDTINDGYIITKKEYIDKIYVLHPKYHCIMKLNICFETKSDDEYLMWKMCGNPYSTSAEHKKLCSFYMCVYTKQLLDQ